MSLSELERATNCSNLSLYQSPTSRWLACVDDLPPLDGPAGVAERLLLLLHYGIPWQGGWVSEHLNRYWDHVLPDRVYASTFHGNLARWWQHVSTELESQPRNHAERLELTQLLTADSDAVLDVLREETTALLLRTRITTAAVRQARADDLQTNGKET